MVYHASIRRLPHILYGTAEITARVLEAVQHPEFSVTDDAARNRLPLPLLSLPQMATRLFKLQRTAAAHSSYVVRVHNANVYHRFGDPNGARPVLRAGDWTMREGESWAVVGSDAGGKTALLEVSERELNS